MVKVTAPASTANLGPGFDCLGAALSRSMTVTGDPGRGDPDNLVVRAARLITGEDVKVKITSGLPVGRGLGSSAACVAAGLLLGCAIAGKDLDREELMRIGTPLEGHPDNLAPALYGGITLVLPSGEVMRFEPSASVRPLVFVPAEKLSTAKARRALPDDVPRANAIANIARASGLLSMLTGAAEATADRLLECTDDAIHQPYRAPLMPQTAEVVRAFRADGVAAAVSGAGPSVVCLVLRGSEGKVRCPEGWQALDVDWDLEGARVNDDD
jgi:homoserine kinase